MDFNKSSRFKISDFLGQHQGQIEPSEAPDIKITKVDVRGKKVEPGLESLRELSKSSPVDKQFLADSDNLFRLMGIETDLQKDFFSSSLAQARSKQGSFLASEPTSLPEDLSFNDAEFIAELAEWYAEIEMKDDLSLKAHAEDLYKFALLFDKHDSANAIIELVPDKQPSKETLDVHNELVKRGLVKPMQSQKEEAMSQLQKILDQRQNMPPVIKDTNNFDEAFDSDSITLDLPDSASNSNDLSELQDFLAMTNLKSYFHKAELFSLKSKGFQDPEAISSKAQERIKQASEGLEPSEVQMITDLARLYATQIQGTDINLPSKYEKVLEIASLRGNEELVEKISDLIAERKEIEEAGVTAFEKASPDQLFNQALSMKPETELSSELIAEFMGIHDIDELDLFNQLRRFHHENNSRKALGFPVMNINDDKDLLEAGLKIESKGQKDLINNIANLAAKVADTTENDFKTHAPKLLQIANHFGKVDISQRITEIMSKA